MDKRMQREFSKHNKVFSFAPIMTKSTPCEPLKLYLSAADFTITAVLVKEFQADQSLVYYARYTLKEAESRYNNVENLVFALVMVSQKLRQYFQGRVIIVMSNHPLHRVLHRLDISSRLASRTVELIQFHLKFQPRTTMKSQELADFVVECAYLLFNNT